MMMRKYIALVLTSTILYGCGGTNSFETAPGDPTQQSPEEEAPFVQLESLYNSGYAVESDEYLLFRDPVAFSFIHYWMTGESAPEVDFENGEVISIAVSKLRSGRMLDFLSVSHYENTTNIEVLETVPSGPSPAKDVYPAAIARFQLTGELSTTFFSRYLYTEETGTTVMQGNIQGFTGEPTYPDLAKKDLEEWYDYNYLEGSLPRCTQGVALISGVDPVCPQHQGFLVEADLAGAGFDYEAYPDAPTHARFCLEGGHYWLLKWGEETTDIFGPLFPGFSNDNE
jgi:hypothetical protein